MENAEIMLSKEEREKLEKYTETGVHSAQLIRRAKIIMDLDRSNKKEHLRIGRICEQNKVTRQTVNKVRAAYMSSESVEAFLTRKKRETPPVASKVTGDVEAHIVALACSEPPAGYAKWAVRLIAWKCVELGYIESISHTKVSEALKKRNISLT